MSYADVTTGGLISALIIDDNAFDRRRFRRFANDTRLNFLLKEASNVEEFGRLLDEERFDVIFVDLNLAGANGMSLLNPVQRHPVNSDAAMIMVAGNSQAEVALQAVRAGFADYIEKEELSNASLERATVNALQKRKLAHVADSAVEDSKSIEAILRNFADMCSNEMRPLMARMTRQVRQLRPQSEAMGLVQNIAEIESTCARMDEFFRDLGALAKEEQLTNILADQMPVGGHAISDSLPVEPTRRPVAQAMAQAPSAPAPRPAAPEKPAAEERQRLFSRR